MSREFCHHPEDKANDSAWKGPITTWPTHCEVGENRTIFSKSYLTNLSNNINKIVTFQCFNVIVVLQIADIIKYKKIHILIPVLLHFAM